MMVTDNTKSKITAVLQANNLNDIAHAFSQYSLEQGFLCYWEIVPEKLMLIVTEVAEAMEAYREGNRANFNEEIADILIRTLDLAGRLEIDIQLETLAKMKKNFNRPYKHGKNT